MKVMPSGYGIVQSSVMRMAGLSISAKALYALIASYTGSKDFCFPSIVQISIDLEIKKLTVIRLLKQLEKNNLLWVERKAGKVSIYHLLIKENTSGQNDTSVPNDTGTSSPNDTTPVAQMIPVIVSSNNNRLIISKLLSFWISQNNTQHSTESIIKHFKKRHFDIIKEYGEQKILDSIKLYSQVIHGSEYWFKYKWDLWDFIARGLDKFLPGKEPLINFKKQKTNSEKYVSKMEPCPVCGIYLSVRRNGEKYCSECETRKKYETL